MTSQLAPYAPARLPVVIEVAIDRWQSGASMPHVPASDLVMARRALKALAAQCSVLARDQPDLVTAWLTQVEGGMSWQSASEEAFFMMQRSVLNASGDLPATSFNDGTRDEALRQLDKLSTRGVDAIVRPAGLALLCRRQALAAVVSAAEPTPEPPVRQDLGPNLTQEERDAVLANFRAKRAECLPQALPVEKAPLRPHPAYLPYPVILARLEEIIASGDERFAGPARLRAAAIRANLPAQMEAEIPSCT